MKIQKNIMLLCNRNFVRQFTWLTNNKPKAVLETIMKLEPAPMSQFKASLLQQWNSIQHATKPIIDLAESTGLDGALEQVLHIQQMKYDGLIIMLNLKKVGQHAPGNY